MTMNENATTILSSFSGFHALRSMAQNSNQKYKALLAEGLEEIEKARAENLLAPEIADRLEGAFRIEMTCMTR